MTQILHIRPSQHVIGVFVHEAEVLEMDFLVSHPVVKVLASIQYGPSREDCSQKSTVYDYFQSKLLGEPGQW